MELSYLTRAIELIIQLCKAGIDPILYGSLGASCHLGRFKASFTDIDLLVPDKWLESDWAQMKQILSTIGYDLTDEHEHEFIDVAGQRIQFAKESILLRDGILGSLDDVITMTKDGHTLRTLNADGFKKAYEFSIRDGYRRDTRKKDDATVIALLEAHISAKA